TIMADKVAGSTSAYAIPMASYEREKSGQGQAIEVPMFETSVSFTSIEHMGGRTFDPPRGGMGYSRVSSPERRPYRTRDGFSASSPYTDAQWQRFFTSAERADSAADPRHADTVQACRQQSYSICDPQAVDRQAKARQQTSSRENGGREAVIARGDLGFTPVPGSALAFD
ncbi:hypothetical protein OY671_010087, partial [Metschnikowia pulcherrima]